VVISAQNPSILLDINLTVEERQWIEEHRTLRVGGPGKFHPFFSFNEEGEAMGIGSEYIEILLSNLGIEIEYQPNLPWNQVLDKAKIKEIDLIAISAKSSEREEFLLFTDPTLSFPLVIISRNDSPFIGGIEDLEKVKVALIDKNITTTWLRDDEIHVNPISVKNPLDALEAVSNGRADAYIGNLATCTYLITKNGLANLKVAAPTKYGYYNLYIAVRNDWPELVSIINKGLKLFTPQEKSQIQNNWLSVKYEYGIQPKDVIIAVLMALGVGAIIVFIILWWNRKLAKEIIIRKKTQRDLEEALHNIRTLQGLLPICASCKNVRDDQGYWKQIEGYLEEHSNVSFTHGMCPDCAKKHYGDQEWFNKLDTKEE